MKKKAYFIVAGVLGAAIGVASGVGGFTFMYAEGASYLTNDPAACANCHVMNDQYDAWIKGPHHGVATCNDCHTPHNFWGKWTTKGINGWNHSLKMTTGNFHEPIQITERNYEVTENACRYCHGDIVEQMDPGFTSHDEWESLSCIRCHSETGHAD